MSTPEAQLLTLVSSDGISLPVERPVAERSILLKNMLSDIHGSADPNEPVQPIEEPIPVPNVSPSPLFSAALTHCASLILSISVIGQRSHLTQGHGVVQTSRQ